MKLAISEIISSQVPESLHLEFKRSDLLVDKRRGEICKAVSAMANADGGRIIFGIAEQKVDGAFSLDGGAADPDRLIEWLDNILTDNIAPRLLDFEVAYEKIGEAFYIYIDIPKSASAPHQAPDYKFYKRSNNRSFPMEAYEIEDIRARRVAFPSPITINLEIEPSSRARLTIFNRSQYVCRDVNLEVRSNFKMSSFGGGSDGAVRLSRVGVGQRIEYTMGTAHGILGSTKDAWISVAGSYKTELSDKLLGVDERISLAELAGSSLPHDDLSDRLKKISEEIRGLRGELNKLSSVSSEISETISGAGVRISPLSIAQAKRPHDAAAFSSHKYDAYGLTLAGMAEVLETSVDVISDFHHAFQVLGGHEMVESGLTELPSEVAERARARLSFER